MAISVHRVQMCGNVIEEAVISWSEQLFDSWENSCAHSIAVPAGAKSCPIRPDLPATVSQP